ncbi:MAG: hypothetical protein ACI9R3_003841 [Verrucomicrobiales bacterium]|jgi:hypothetical protein
MDPTYRCTIEIQYSIVSAWLHVRHAGDFSLQQHRGFRSCAHFFFDYNARSLQKRILKAILTSTYSAEDGSAPLAERDGTISTVHSSDRKSWLQN